MIKNNFKWFVGGFLVLIALLLGYIINDCFSSRVVWNHEKNQPDESSQFAFYSQLTGLGTNNQSEAMPSVAAIMIDNHFDARPQFGLELAPIVYEAPVEGGITRFMAIFSAQSSTVIAKVGPVRSARPYFLDWSSEYGDALYMHSGGSPEALALIKSRKIFDANEFWWGENYWRDDIYTAPHNLFTSSSNWQSIIAEYSPKRGLPAWSGWKYYEQITTSSLSPISQIIINYAPNYKVQWKWDATRKVYLRTVNGINVNSNQEIVAKNILIQKVEMVSTDEVDRKKITTLGSGEAQVLRDGVVINGIWKKDELSGRTRFYNNNQEISLHPGNTWVQVVPAEVEVNEM